MSRECPNLFQVVLARQLLAERDRPSRMRPVASYCELAPAPAGRVVVRRPVQPLVGGGFEIKHIPHLIEATHSAVVPKEVLLPAQTLDSCYERGQTGQRLSSAQALSPAASRSVMRARRQPDVDGTIVQERLECSPSYSASSKRSSKIRAYARPACSIPSVLA